MPLLSGLLIATSYIPFPPWAAPFCFVPLWLFWLREPSTRKILWGGWLAQFVLCGIAFHWIPRTIHDFGGLPWAAGAGALALFAAFGHLFLVLSGLAFAVLRDRFRLSPGAQR
ncbi:MAG: apolipoprotein N-acyltransferase, partial [Deltaproteobacteria bacterium]|nr:apolipoprotein N-acyltransferase [Deltaproteobacteria bacterium]